MGVGRLALPKIHTPNAKLLCQDLSGKWPDSARKLKHMAPGVASLNRNQATNHCDLAGAGALDGGCRHRGLDRAAGWRWGGGHGAHWLGKTHDGTSHYRQMWAWSGGLRRNGLGGGE
jgi:hypothetical protein